MGSRRQKIWPVFLASKTQPRVRQRDRGDLQLTLTQTEFKELNECTFILWTMRARRIRKKPWRTSFKSKFQRSKKGATHFLYSSPPRTPSSRTLISNWRN